MGERDASWGDDRPALIPLDRPERGQPLYHELTCVACYWRTSHTNPAQSYCGLCRMDRTNASYRAAFGGRRAS